MSKRAPRVCIAVHPRDPLGEELESACDPVRVSPLPAREELTEAVHDAEGLLISNQIPVDGDLLDAAPKLRVVSGIGVGYDRFDVDAATQRGVAVCYTPDVVTTAVVEMTLGVLISLTRRLFENEAYVRSGGWARRERPPGLGVDLGGKVLGIVGLGRIGRQVTARAQALGMHVIFNDVFDRAPPDAPQIPYRALDALLRESDVVSLHPDLNPTSHHLIGARELALMKPTAYLINLSRGPVVDQAALTAALQSHTIRGAALDVLEQEPPGADDSIFTPPNVAIFPHMGTATRETRQAMRDLAVRNLLAVLRGETPPACVNPAVLTNPSPRRAP